MRQPPDGTDVVQMVSQKFCIVRLCKHATHSFIITGNRISHTALLQAPLTSQLSYCCNQNNHLMFKHYTAVTPSSKPSALLFSVPRLQIKTALCIGLALLQIYISTDASAHTTAALTDSFRKLICAAGETDSKGCA